MDEATLQAVARRAQAGEPQAFAELYRHFYRRVFGLCRRLLGSAQAAEDAGAEVFLRAQRAMSTYDSRLSFSGWLLSIASHYCLDQLRDRRVEQRVFDSRAAEWNEPATAAPSPLAELLAAERSAAVRAALEALPERTRLVVALRYHGELSYDQIAAALGLNRNHVATLLWRAKKELQRSLLVLSRERKA
jgi:RNA polymerase sigma-70 factor (ECF subfamily)